MSTQSKVYNIVGSIVLYNPNIKKLKKVLYSFYSSNNLNTKLCLIDNSPTRTSELDKLLEEYKDIDYIFNGKNLGYGSGHNIAIKKYADCARYYLIINPDVFFDEKLLTIIYKRLEKRPDIALASTKILYNNGNQQFTHKKLPNPTDIILRLLSNKLLILGSILSKIFKKQMKEYELQHLYKNESFFCPSVSGCFMFFRSEALMNIKGFDEDFFLYFEDVDLSRRCATKYKNIIFCDLKIFHSWDRGGHKKLKLFLYQAKSAIKYFNKWGWCFDKKRKELNSVIKFNTY
jgi:hypothetical protein